MLKSASLSSTAITSAAYDTDTQVLTITFTNGRAYDYRDVPEKVYDELVDSPSPGRYHATYIKGIYS